MTIRRIIAVALLLGALSACTFPQSDLKSPCVGNPGSPCGPRIPVNDWWLKADKA